VRAGFGVFKRPLAGLKSTSSREDPDHLPGLWGGDMAAGAPPVTERILYPAARAAASVLETAWRLAGAKSEPPLTRFVLRQLTTAHWFDISAARRDLGYEPAVTIEEGMRRLSDWLRSGGK